MWLSEKFATILNQSEKSFMTEVYLEVYLELCWHVFIDLERKITVCGILMVDIVHY